MKGWKFSFLFLLAYLFVFFVVVIGKEDPRVYIRENPLRAGTYALFAVAKIVVATRQRRKRSIIPMREESILPPKEERNLIGIVHDNNTRVEIFKREKFGLFNKSHRIEYFSHVDMDIKRPLVALKKTG